MPKGKEPFYIFLQAESSLQEFIVLSEQELCLLPSSLLIIVFEVIVLLSKHQASEHLQKYGFTDMVLLQAALAPPYEPTSSLKDIKDLNAVTEILTYRERESEIRNFFTIDHIYLNRLDAEMKKGKP